MGVIDEAAIDRLFLVSELSKHVCVQTKTRLISEHPGAVGSDWLTITPYRGETLEHAIKKFHQDLDLCR